MDRCRCGAPLFEDRCIGSGYVWNVCGAWNKPERAARAEDDRHLQAMGPGAALFRNAFVCMGILELRREWREHENKEQTP